MRVEAFADGRLEFECVPGALGTVDSWQETEAWNLVSLGDARLVATTGGGVTVCRSRVRLTLGPPRQSLGLAGHELVVWVGALGSGCV